MMKGLSALAAAIVVSGCSTVLAIPDRTDDGHVRCDGGSCGCEDGFVDCNDDRSDGCEVEVASDADHCGACGHGCGGGVCKDGACLPLRIAAIGEAAALVVHGDFVYFTEVGAPGLQRVPVGGGAPELFAPGKGHGGGIAIFGDTAFWGDAALHAVKLDGSSPHVLEAAPVMLGTFDGQICSAIAATPSTVYAGWGFGPDPIFGELDAIDLGSGAITELTQTNGFPPDVEVDADQARVFWGDQNANQLRVFDLATQKASRLYAIGAIRIFQRFTLAAGELYVTEAGAEGKSRIVKLPETGTPTVTVETETGFPNAIRVRDGQVFWTNATEGLVEALEGDQTKILARGQDEPRTIDVDSGFVYFGVKGALERVAR